MHKILVRADIDLPTHCETSVWLELETNLIPNKGMDFEHAAWKVAREIVHVTTDLVDSYTIYMGAETVPDAKALDDRVKMYEGHGWKRTGDWLLKA